jgi:hypothetical protein
VLTLAVAAAAARPVEATGFHARLYWGAWIGSQLTGREAPWDMSAVDAFENGVGKHVSIVHFSSPFASCSPSPCSFFAFPTHAMNAVRSHGSIPFFSWASAALPLTPDESEFQLADITNGTYDSYIESFAAAAKAWGHPFFLRFDWEMNGDWFPWADGANGNRPGDFVAAWRHVHDLFRAVGVSNATWVWCPNIGRTARLAELYPGDSYVDWTCLDGYNTGNPWRSFGALFRPSYRLVTAGIAPSKPMIIGETGSTEAGGSKAAWIADALSSVSMGYPKLKGLLYFDKFDKMDWPIETSNAARRAFAHAIASPEFATNRFKRLGPGRIQPLSH